MMFKPFANTARAASPGPLTWRTWTGLVLLPLLVVGLLGWAFWQPLHADGEAKAAVVNLDEPVRVGGQLVPLGREVAGELTHDEDTNYDWVLTDAEDARAGVDDGTYAAAVTIPKDFSARATSPAAEDPMAASQAVLRVDTSTNTGVVDPVASEDVADATLATVNRQVVETYLDGIYVAFGTMHEQLSEAADGASDLAAGTGELDTAAKQLATGADELASGTGQLAVGSKQLSAGLGKAEKDTEDLPELTRQLATGARQVANGNEALAAKVVPLANRVIEAIDAVPSAKTAAKKFAKLADRCSANGGDAQFCSQLSAAAATFAKDAKVIDGKLGQIRAAAVETKRSVKALARGSAKVADGNERLAASSKQLTRGISDAADGARQLDTGVRKAHGGATRLASGADQLSTGTSRVDAGAEELASGLDEGRDQVPTYTERERDHLKEVAATPAESRSSRSPDLGGAAMVLFAVLALWAGALAVYVVTRAVPSDVLTSRRPTWQIVLSAAVPGTSIAVLTSALLSLALVPLLDLGAGDGVAFFGVTLLAALAFTAVNQAIVGIFRRPGRLLSIAVVVLTLATGVVAAVPELVGAVGAVLPTHGALLALRAVVMGADGGLAGVVELAVWLLLGVAATVVVTDRRRTVGARQLRLPRSPRAHAALTS